MKKFKLAALAGVFLAATTMVAAGADLAVVKKSVNVRGGPGATFPVVGQLSTGTNIQVAGCQGGWCQIVWPGGQAFVSCSFLTCGCGTPVVAVQPQPIYVEAPPPAIVAPTIVVTPPRAPLYYAPPNPILYYPPPPRYYGPAPAPGPLVGPAPGSGPFPGGPSW